MFVEDYAVARSVPEAARYLNACSELDAALIESSDNEAAMFDLDWCPSDEYKEAVLGLYRKLSSEISDALDRFRSGTHEDGIEPLGFAQESSFEAWMAAREKSGAAQLAKFGWVHRVSNVITEIVRRGNGKGLLGDFETILIVSIVADHLGFERRHVLATQVTS